MDLDTAQRISLIQRNMEMAQTAIDSAAELLKVVLEGFMHTPDVPAPVKRAPVKTVAKAAKKATKKATKKTATGLKQDNHFLLQEFAAHHSGEFKVDDVMKWVREHGYAVDDAKLRNAIYNSANSKKVIVAVGRGTGVYKRIAA